MTAEGTVRFVTAPGPRRTHRLSLDDAPEGYETFKNKQDECVKVVLKR
jgi:threonine dehydrogenase-like Zn-dependent dehydrogenase